MMKKILSVALSVIMMLSLIAVPGLAAEPASAAVVTPAVEYTVSAVTYTKAGSTLTASVDVTASTADNKVSVIYAVLQDGALESAEFETKTVGTSKVNFNKALTFDAAKTYKIFVVESATGRAIAPEANYPTHENALAYVDVTYGSGEKERHIVEGDTITLLHTPEREAAGNPTFKFVPVDNSSKIVAEGGRDFWAQKKTVTVTGLDGDVKTYTVEANTIRLTFKPTVSNDYLYENLGGSVMYKTAVDSVNVAFGKADKEITVDVPAGTSQVMMSSFESGNIKIPGATITLSAAKATHTFTINEEEYKIHLRWDVNAPGIYNVTRDFKAPERSFFLRANGKSLYAQHGLQKTDMQKVGTSVVVKGGDALAGDSANMNVTILKDGVDTPLRNDASTLALVHTTAETANRQVDAFDSSVDKITGSWMKGNTTGEWFKFTPTAAGTVYVRATQADAMTAGYKWDEITNADGTLKDGWKEVAGAKLSGEAIKLFAKDFEADEPVVIPTQAFDRDEYKYAARTLGLAMTDYSEGSIPGITAKSNNLFYRASNIYSTGKTTGYNAFVLITFDAELSGDQYDPAAPGADQLDLWYSTSAAISEPATQTATAANIAGNNSIYAGGIYKVAASDYMEAEVNQTAKTFEIVVPYGTEVVNLAVSDKAGNAFAGESYDLLSRGGTQNATVKIGPADAQITYRGTIKWAAFDANAMSENAPLVYNLKYNMEGKELVGDTTYSVMPTRLTLKPAGNPVAGSGVLKGESMDGDVTEWAEGTWFTVASHNSGNYTALDNGAHYNKLHISAASFENWVAAGTLADAYALDGATLLVADYKDAMTGARYEFTTAKAGYVIAAYAAEQNLPGWTLLADTALATTAGATDAEKDLIKWPPVGHTNPVSDFAVWGDSYDYVYIKVVSADEDVVINETASTANMPPVVMVTDKELFTAPTLAGLTYSIGDGAPVAIEIAEGVTTATVNVPFTKEAISVVGEINGTGRAVADRALTLNWDNRADNVITVEVLDVFGNVRKTYEIAFEMDFDSAPTPDLATLTYAIGDGEAQAIAFADATEITVPTLAYTADAIKVAATLTSDGFVEISDDEFVIEYVAAEGDIVTKTITVTVKNIKGEVVKTYTINFAMDFSTVADPTFAGIFYKVGNGELVAIEDLIANAKTIAFDSFIAEAVSVEGTHTGSGYWEYSVDAVTFDENNTIRTITAKLFSAKGTLIDTYTITFTIPAKPALEVKFTPALTTYMDFAGTEATKNRVTYTQQTKAFAAGPQEYVVTVPYATASIAVAPIETTLGEADGFTLDFEGKDVAEKSIEIGGYTYNVTFKWEHNSPYVYDVAMNTYYDKRNIVLRGSDNGLLGYGTGSGDIKDTTTSVSVFTSTTQYENTTLAGENDTVLNFTVNGKTIDKKYATVFTISNTDNYVRPDMLQYAGANKVGWHETDAWVSFRASDSGKVYVKMSHANAKEANFEWPEGKAAGWVKETNVAGVDSVLYSKTFAAGDLVKVPSQMPTEQELAYVNAKIAEEYPAGGPVQLKYVLCDTEKSGYGAQMYYSEDGKAYDAADKTWTAVPAANKTGVTLDKLHLGSYARRAGRNYTGLGFQYGYSTFVVVAFNQPASLGGLSYTVAGGSAENVTLENGAASIEVPFGTESVSLKHTVVGDGDVEYSEQTLVLSNDKRTGTVTATLKNADGSIVDTYEVTFTWAEPVAPVLETLTYNVGDGIDVDAKALLESNAAEIEVDFGTTNISVDATKSGDGSIEIGDAIVLSEAHKEDSIVVKLTDVDGIETEYTLTFKWKALEAPVFDKLYYKIGDGELVEITDITDKVANVEVPFGTASVSVVLTKTGAGSVVPSADALELTAANNRGALTATIKDYYGADVETYTVNFAWANPTVAWESALALASKPLTVTQGPKTNFYADGLYAVGTKSGNVELDLETKTATLTVPYGVEKVVFENGVEVNLLGDTDHSVDTNVTVAGIEFAVTVKWAGYEYVAGMPLLYDLEYFVAGKENLAGGITAKGDSYYYVKPTALVLDAEHDLVVGETELKGEWTNPDNGKTIKVNLAAGDWYTLPSHQKTNLSVHNNGAAINRLHVSPTTLEFMVTNGAVANKYALNGATILVPHYQDKVENNAVRYKFKAAQDGYVISVSKVANTALTEADGWKLIADNTSGSNPFKPTNGSTGDAGKALQNPPDGHTNAVKEYAVHEHLYGFVYIKAVDAGEVVEIKESTVVNEDCPPVVIVATEDMINADILTPVTPTAQSDTEDTGIAAVVADDVASEQGAGTTDVSVSGSDAAYANEVVAVYVLAEGKTMSDLVTLLANPSGDLADPTNGVILAMGKAWADEEGNFTIDLTLPPEAETGRYNVGIVTDTAEQAQLDYVDLDDQVIAFNAIVNAADGIGSMETAFANIAHIINTNDIYVALGADQAVVQNSVKNNAEVIAMNTIAVPTADIAKLAAIIDARIAVEILNNGDTTLFDEIKGYVLDNTTLTADALAIYEGDALNAAGKANVLSAIAGKNFEVTATQTIQQQVSAAFEQAVFVNLINNTAYNANAVLPNVVKFNSVLRGTNGVAMNAVTLTALAEIMNGEDITGYTDFADRVNVLTAAPSDPVPPTPGDQTGGVANDNRPPQTEGGTTGGGQSYPVGPTTKLLSTFTDANQAAWAATALQTMLDRNILSGYEDNTIRPNNSATRQEVAKMLVEAFSKVRPYAWTGFSDVPAGSWYYSYVATAAEDGIIKGMGDGQFGTDANITREDLSVLIYRFLVNKGIAMNSASTRTFTDAASMSDYAIEAINALTNAGIVNGYTDGSYNAKGNATRAEIAQIIANVLVIYAL